MFPITEKLIAKKKSKYREKGEEYDKPINVTKDVYKDFIMNKVFPAVKKTVPAAMLNKPIYFDAVIEALVLSR
jgi:hypothetical protein